MAESSEGFEPSEQSAASETSQPADQGTAGEPIDLLEALKSSINAAREGAGLELKAFLSSESAGFLKRLDRRHPDEAERIVSEIKQLADPRITAASVQVPGTGYRMALLDGGYRVMFRFLNEDEKEHVRGIEPTDSAVVVADIGKVKV